MNGARRLLLWRHGSANHYQDQQRILDPRGQRQAAASADWLHRHYPDCLLWSSPARRAQQTAAYYREDFLVRPELSAGSDEATVLATVESCADTPLLLVGHQMWIGALAARLSGQRDLLFYNPSQLTVFAESDGRWQLIDGFWPEV